MQFRVEGGSLMEWTVLFLALAAIFTFGFCLGHRIGYEDGVFDCGGAAQARRRAYSGR